ncbi:MAG: hypothetical protein ACYTHK_16930 [Planctomycetota bacterium]
MLVLGTLIVAPVLAYVFFMPRRHLPAEQVEDMNNVRWMLGPIMSAPTIHATADGRIDVYRTVFTSIELDEDNAALLHHRRTDAGPTIEEVRAGDYSNFVWERAKADDVRGAKGKVPVLWDPRPIDGKRIVGFASGLVKIFPEAEFTALLD